MFYCKDSLVPVNRDFQILRYENAFNTARNNSIGIDVDSNSLADENGSFETLRNASDKNRSHLMKNKKNVESLLFR